MAANVLFKLLTEAQWDALTTKDNGTLYRVQKTGGGEDFYQGSNKLNGAADIDAAIAALDASVSQTAGADGLALSATEVDGKLTAISGSIAANTYDAYGAASTAKSEVIGQSGDLSDANTIYGAKAYADAAAAAVSFDAEDIGYDNTTSGLTADDVQEAIDEVYGGLGTAAAADVATSAIQEESTDDSLVSAEQVAAFVASEIAGLEGAMHFRGVVTRQTGETDAEALARAISNPTSGDVAVMSDNAKEYIYSGSAWREVGDEGLYVQKTTTIAGIDLEDNITASELQTALSLGSAAYENTNAFEAAGTTATAIAALDADVDASGTAQHSGTFVVSGITEVDGVITSVDSVEVEAAGAAAALEATLADVATSGVAADVVYEEGTGGASDISVKDAIDDLYDAIGTGGSVDDKIAAAIGDLDATESQTAGADGLALSITEADGIITSISGSIASGTYDAAGAAAAVLGTSSDVSTDATVYGAKAYADSLASNYDPAGSAASALSTAEAYTDSCLTWVQVTE